MGISFSIYETVVGLGHLFKTPISFKIKILANYVRIVLKNVFFRLFGITATHEKLFGLTVSFFDYSTFSFLYREIFLKNEYFFKARVRRPLIIDAGANIGMATLYFKLLYPDATVYCFEPDTNAFHVLERNVKVNGLKHVQLFNYALSDVGRDVFLYVSTHAKAAGTSSLNQNRKKSVKMVPVKAKKLSDYLNKRVDFLKMDVEGAEESIISELERAGKLKNLQETVVEYHHKIGREKSRLSVFLQILERNGFEYQIDCSNMPLSGKDKFQDIMIFAYRS